MRVSIAHSGEGALIAPRLVQRIAPCRNDLALVCRSRPRSVLLLRPARCMKQLHMLVIADGVLGRKLGKQCALSRVNDTIREHRSHH